MSDLREKHWDSRMISLPLIRISPDQTQDSYLQRNVSEVIPEDQSNVPHGT